MYTLYHIISLCIRIVYIGAIPNLNLPDVCTAIYTSKRASILQSHCILIKKDVPDVPTGLREFIKYCRSGKHDLMSFQGL